MAQGFSTGGGGLIVMWGVNYRYSGLEPQAVIVPPETAIPSGLRAMKYDDTVIFGHGIYSNAEDEVIVISAASSLDGTPKSITFTVDRDDEHSMRFLQRYCPTLRPSMEQPEGTSTTAKLSEDGLSVRGEATEAGGVNILDCVFFVWFGAPVKGMDGKTKRKIAYGIGSISGATPNISTGYETDNTFSFTINAQPQKVDAEIELTDLYIPKSVVASGVGTGIGSSFSSKGILTGESDISKLFPVGYELYLPKNTGILVDVI